MSKILYRASLVGGLLLAAAPAFAQEVNLYTHREPGLIKPLLDQFTAQTGIKVNTVFAKAGLAERIQSEGEKSPADLLLSVDVSTLTHAAGLGITQPILTPALEKAIPATYRAKDGSWVGVSARARVIYASKDRVKDEALTYEALAEPRFKGKVCIRSGLHEYNTAMIAQSIASQGVATTDTWVKGLKANLARKPSGGDRDVAKDIAAGLCDIGIGNTYYVGLMKQDATQSAWAGAIKVIVPTFKSGGTNVNISGLVLARNAPHKADALKLAEWLTSPAAQQLYAARNFEYPVVEGVPVDPAIAAFGRPKMEGVNLEAMAAQRKAASELVEKTGFDLGPQG